MSSTWCDFIGDTFVSLFAGSPAQAAYKCHVERATGHENPAMAKLEEFFYT